MFVIVADFGVFGKDLGAGFEAVGWPSFYPCKSEIACGKRGVSFFCSYVLLVVREMSIRLYYELLLIFYFYLNIASPEHFPPSK
jgi:hypothetical protein